MYTMFILASVEKSNTLTKTPIRLNNNTDYLSNNTVFAEILFLNFQKGSIIIAKSIHVSFS